MEDDEDDDEEEGEEEEVDAEGSTASLRDIGPEGREEELAAEEEDEGKDDESTIAKGTTRFLTKPWKWVRAVSSCPK